MTKQLKKQIDELPMYQRYVKTVLNIEKGVRGIVCNGRLIGPFDDNEEFSNEDFSLLERFSQTSYGDKLFKKLIKEQLLEDDEYGMNTELAGGHSETTIIQRNPHRIR